MSEFATPETSSRAITVPLSFGSLDIDLDAAPFSLAESDHAQRTAGHVADEDRDPHVDRLERAVSLKNETDAERDDDL
jgi:hypothetical protein